jgi:hypothetical protein
VLITPLQAPNANAYAERWIRTVWAECLDWLLIVGQGHPEQVLHADVEHDNVHVPTKPSGWNRRFHGSVRPPSQEISAEWTRETGSAACSMSITDKLHDGVAAPYAHCTLQPTPGQPQPRASRDGRTAARQPPSGCGITAATTSGLLATVRLGRGVDRSAMARPFDSATR